MGSAIAPLTPTVTGDVTSYGVSPALPAGLAFDAGTGRISGTPTAATAATHYTITAANSGGSAAFALPITVIGVEVVSGSISRFVSSTTSIDVAVVIRPLHFTFTGTLNVAAEEPTGVFARNVEVAPNDDGSYTLTLATVASAAPDQYDDELLLKLCSDQSCTTPQSVASVAVPFVVNVMASGGAWPGDHLSPLVAWSDVPEWETHQGNAAHTGHVPVALDPDEFTTRWTLSAVTIGGGWTSNVANLATADGQFFVAGNNTLYARREHDGGEEWRYDFSGLIYPSVNPPAVARGVVYVAAGQQYSTEMFAFDATDGSIVFRAPMSSQWEHYLAPTIGPSGVYTNAGTYGGLYAFDPTGQELFFDSALLQTSVWTPAVDESGLYVYAGGGLKVLNPVSGAALDTIDDPTYQNYIYEIGGAPVIGAPGSVFAAHYANAAVLDMQNALMNFRVATSSIEWQVNGSYPTTPAYDDGVLYATNHAPLRLEARAEADGALLWWWTPPHAADFEFTSEVLLTENLVFVSTNHTTYAIDRASHRAVWSYPAPGRLALSRNGVLYIQGAGMLIAVNVK